MNRIGRRLVLALGSALIGATVLAAPVAAATPDGAYAKFNLSIDGDIGLIFLSYTGTTTINAGFTGLGGTDVSVRGSSQGCAKPPTTSNTVFNVTGSTNDEGTMWLRSSVPISSVVHSIWLDDGNYPPQCAISFNFDRMDLGVVGDWNGDAVLGIWDKEHVLSLLERRPNNQAVLRIVAKGFQGTETFTYSAVNRGCGHQPTRRLFKVNVFVNGGHSDKYKRLSSTPNEMGSIRSFRLRYATTVLCTPQVIMANTEGDFH